MNPVLIVSILCAALQGANLFLFLKIRVAQLETERRILDKVACEFASQGVCKAQMENHERRVTLLEEYRAA